MRNALYFGDNLDILRRYLKDETVDLIYLDPPFNSNASYNVLFKEEDGTQAASQIQAFEDTWHWHDAAAQFDETVRAGRSPTPSWPSSACWAATPCWRQNRTVV
jgi:site-specific DNA-methyltransferase (adenine-specific)